MNGFVPIMVAVLAVQSSSMSYAQPKFARAYAWVSGFACGTLLFMGVDAFIKTM